MKITENYSDSISLDKIGLKHGTDKSSLHHDYLAFYESYFDGLREKRITLLEIGVAHGASVKTWEEYFKDAKIIGADIVPSSKMYEHGRIVIELIDQSNIEDLVRIAVKHGPFDIIIEDGSHLWEHQITSLRTLFPFLKDDGIYIVEDLQTNYGSMQQSYRGVASEACTEYLKRWADLTIADEQIDLSHIEDAFLRTYGSSAKHITFYRHSCIIKKNIKSGIKYSNEYLSEDHLTDIPFSIVGHYGNVGDVDFGSNYLNLKSPNLELQGICILALIKDVFEYRTKSEIGVWGSWVEAGIFSGSRGESKNITGFSMRLNGKYKAMYKIKIYCGFYGSDKVVESDSNCESQDGSAISGIQVSIIKTKVF